MNNLSIIYYTDNSLKEPIFSMCQNKLIQSSCGTPIISVSQKPIDLGKNICVGELGRSYISYYTQILTGLQNTDTKYVATVEHDCLYTPEHFTFLPLKDDIFYYNKNVWFVDYETGRYSYYPRKVQSNLICNRELLIEAISEKLEMSQSDYPSEGRAKFKCEPGVCDYRKEFIKEKTGWCQRHNRNFRQYQCDWFETVEPNLDIRHKGNFTKPGSYPKSGNFTNILPFYGNFNDFIGKI